MHSAQPAQPAEDPGPLSDLLCFDLYAASRSLTAVYRPLLEPLGLTYPQYLVMVVLWRDGRATVREIAGRLRLDYNTVSPLLKRLESAGLLTRRRRPDDERTVEITLTGEGRALREKARAIPATIGEAVGIDETAVIRLQSMLRAVTSSATAHAAEHATRASAPAPEGVPR